MTDIYFIRHAESFGNLTRRAYGWYDGIITPKGYEQIKCLEKRFEKIKIDAVYSSDLFRTRKTAEAICVPKKLPLNTDARFREVGIGLWEDMPWGKIPSLYPDEYRSWTENPLDFNVAGGETYYEVYQRAKATLDEIVLQNECKAIAVVSHGATLRMLMHGITHDDNLDNVAEDDWGDNTCVSHFRADNGRYTEVLKNDNSHLCDMPGFEENMRWVREGIGRNLWFESAKFPHDKQKLRQYHSEAYYHVFGNEISDIKSIDSKVKRVLRQDKNNIVFGYCPAGEVGMIELDENVSLYPSAGHISVLYLNPEFRRQRYGIQFIGHAMSKYKRMGKKYISVRVAEKNTAAHGFYKKYGFYEVFRETEVDVRQIVMLLEI